MNLNFVVRIIKSVLIIIFVLILTSALVLTGINYLSPKLTTPISILVLGKGGEGHTAPNLTDTIMLVNLNTNLTKTTVLSLPRDIWIPEIRAKLNSSYYWGKQKGGNGFDLASQNVYSVTGITPTYFAVVDFSLFKDLIDTVGGINVDVLSSFTDEKYPIEGKENDLCDGDKLYKCRFETIKFEKGIQKMDGATALKFVRSRNSTGDEGTDLAREKRQQKIIESLKEKLFSNEILLNPSTMKSLYDVAIAHVETNIDKKTFLTIGRFVFESRNNIKFLSVPEEFIKISQNEKKYDMQYVFIPENGSWNDFKTWINLEI